MANPKIKGAGGFGQYDLGTATQDVRAATPRSQTRGGGSGDRSMYIPSGPGYTTPLKPGDPGYTPLRTTGRNKGRGGRKGRSSGRKTR